MKLAIITAIVSLATLTASAESIIVPTKDNVKQFSEIQDALDAGRRGGFTDIGQGFYVSNRTFRVNGGDPGAITYKSGQLLMVMQVKCAGTDPIKMRAQILPSPNLTPWHIPPIGSIAYSEAEFICANAD